MADRRHTYKQMGDAGEMLVAAELTLHGVPTFTVPDFWPGCDVIAQPMQSGMKPQRVSVKTRTYKRKDSFVGYDDIDEFDWLAVVILPGPGFDRRRFFIVPREIANPDIREWRVDLSDRSLSAPTCPWLRVRDGLPLHVRDAIGSAAIQRPDVIFDVAGAGAGRAPRRGARM